MFRASIMILCSVAFCGCALQDRRTPGDKIAGAVYDTFRPAKEVALEREYARRNQIKSGFQYLSPYPPVLWRGDSMLRGNKIAPINSWDHFTRSIGPTPTNRVQIDGVWRSAKTDDPLRGLGADGHESAIVRMALDRASVEEVDLRNSTVVYAAPDSASPFTSYLRFIGGIVYFANSNTAYWTPSSNEKKSTRIAWELVGDRVCLQFRLERVCMIALESPRKQAYLEVDGGENSGLIYFVRIKTPGDAYSLARSSAN